MDSLNNRKSKHMTHEPGTSVTVTTCGSADHESQSITLACKLASLQNDYDRLLADKLSLPQGWQAVKMAETVVRINAISPNGDQCHWILDTGSDT